MQTLLINRTKTRKTWAEWKEKEGKIDLSDRRVLTAYYRKGETKPYRIMEK